MHNNSVKCNHCSKEITSKEDLVISKWYSFIFKKYHKECYTQVVSEHQNKVSKPLDFKSNIISLAILNVIILAFVILTVGTTKLTFVGLLLLAIIGLDIPYFLTWLKVLRPLTK